MTPTPKLRFVERKVYVSKPAHNYYENEGTFSELVKKIILQQWWENKNIVLAIHVEDKDGNPLPPPTHGEWRDVPLEKEA